MSPISNFARTTLACAVAALLGGCVIAGDVRPYPAMAPIQPIMPPQAEPTAGAIYAAGPTCSCIRTVARAMSATC